MKEIRTLPSDALSSIPPVNATFLISNGRPGSLCLVIVHLPT